MLTTAAVSAGDTSVTATHGPRSPSKSMRSASRISPSRSSSQPCEGRHSLRIVSSRVVTVDLPGFAKKALKPTNTIVQTDEWRRDADGSWSGTFTGDVKGSPVNISGTMTLTPGGTGTEHTVTIDVEVKIPLIGGKIADWAGKNDVRRTLDAEFAFNDARLSRP